MTLRTESGQVEQAASHFTKTTATMRNCAAKGRIRSRCPRQAFEKE